MWVRASYFAARALSPLNLPLSKGGQLGVAGLAEETIPFYGILIPVMLTAGYDSLTAVRAPPSPTWDACAVTRRRGGGEEKWLGK